MFTEKKIPLVLSVILLQIHKEIFILMKPVLSMSLTLTH